MMLCCTQGIDINDTQDFMENRVLGIFSEAFQYDNQVRPKRSRLEKIGQAN